MKWRRGEARRGENRTQGKRGGETGVERRGEGMERTKEEKN